MTRFSLALCGLLLSALPSTAALADTVDFNFSFTGSNGISGMGSFSAIQDGKNTMLIESISGTSDTGNGVNQNIGGLLTPLGFGANDDLLLFSPSTDKFSLDGSGISYMLQNGADIELFGSGADGGVFLQRVNGVELSEAADITITQVASAPEPRSLVLLGTGVLAFAGTVRRRFLA